MRPKPSIRRFLTPGILLGLFIAAFSPTSGTLGDLYQAIARPPARLVRLFITPGASAFDFITSSLRDSGQANLRLAALMELQEQVWHDAVLWQLYNDNQRLRRENAALQNINERFAGLDVALPMVPVTARRFEASGHHFTLGHGARHHIASGQVVVVGPNLVGQVIESGRSSATVRLISSPGTVLNTIVAPANWSRTGLLRSQLETRQFEAGPDGQLRALVAHDAPVAVGQVAFLRDEDWPDEAQGWAVGQVSAIEPVDEHPLRVSLTLKLLRPFEFIDKVVVIVPQSPPAEAAP